jgi:ABC-2 type transport system ATP-binding protein
VIEHLAGEGTTILLTTHYLPEAEALADRVAVLASGEIVAFGAPATLGGRVTQDAQVSWEAPDGRRTLQTATPTKVVTDLAAQFGGEVPGLAVSRPSLEDVYLELIGAGR